MQGAAELGLPHRRFSTAGYWTWVPRLRHWCRAPLVEGDQFPLSLRTATSSGRLISSRTAALQCSEMVAAEPSRTIVLLLTPEAEPILGELRRRHTPGGKRGMPSHVTLLTPFVNVDDFGPEIVDRLSRALADARAFDFNFARVERFDAGVLYLSVEPVDQVRALIRRLCDEFPDRQPYGVYTPDTVIPHQTLATGEAFPDGVTSKDEELFSDIEAGIAHVLPISCRARDVAVMADGPDGWTLKWQVSLR